MPHDPSIAILQARASALEIIDEVGRVLAAELNLDKLIGAITDATTRLTEARFGAFFSNDAVLGTHEEPAPGTSRLSAEQFPIPRDAPLLDLTFRGQSAIRIADLFQDPRHTPGTLTAHTPVCSYLAAPVISPTGEVLGGLFFAHSEVDHFSPEHERLLVGISRYAAIAIDNARLYERARSADLATARLAAIVQSSDDAIVSKDLNGTVLTWNAAAERIFGWTAQEMIGRSITIIIPPDRPDEEPGILARLRRGERIDHFETVRVRKDGRLINISVTTSPLKDATGRIIGASKVARDITEKKRAETERETLLAAERTARSQAEQHGRMKDEFLATLGHELRTPLNAILGWSQLLRRPNVSSDDLAQGLAVVERNARLQAQLIEDLLDMSRIISGKIRLNVQSIELPAIIEAAIESVRPAADAKSIRLQMVLDRRCGPVSGDPARIQQIAWNLLSNAVKFTPRGGRVQVLLEKVDSMVRFSVCDNGEGIAPDFLPMVFDRFRQADPSTTRRHGGLGLGLAIVKHLVELHGGTVRAASPGIGMGASFHVSLPVRAALEDAFAAPAPAYPVASLAADISLEGINVVLVDDEPDARDLVSRILKDAGAKVTPAASAHDAIQAIEASPPDVIISDIGMPEEDGYSLIRRLRESASRPAATTPAIALTAFARAEDRRRALLAGFQMHVPKPVEAAELLAVIASVTRRLK